MGKRFGHGGSPTLVSHTPGLCSRIGPLRLVQVSVADVGCTRLGARPALGSATLPAFPAPSGYGGGGGMNLGYALSCKQCFLLHVYQKSNGN